MELKKIKLNKLAENSLAERQMQGIKGGSSCCGCGCYYAGRGGSSTHDNGVANSKHCYTSTRPDEYTIDIPEVIIIGKPRR
ncbi:MAG: TIGR04149 family rSAM-modified RiPP [Porphyromonas sp.]|nr:TIGR04149 family rSAM-modified RiPP [Porphyromonas sp.]